MYEKEESHVGFDNRDQRCRESADHLTSYCSLLFSLALATEPTTRLTGP